MQGRHGRGQGKGRGRGGRRGRWAGWLDPVLLLLLHHGPAHGYTLLSQLGRFGLEEIDPSIVYRALREMEVQELVSSTWDTKETQGPPRRIYQITGEGNHALHQNIQALTAERDSINTFLDAYHSHMEEGSGAFHDS